jgi:hypothetical protein
MTTEARLKKTSVHQGRGHRIEVGLELVSAQG